MRTMRAAYLEPGADMVPTTTCGGAPYVPGEYGLAERAYELSRAAARLAREVAGARFVVGAMGPGTRSISVTRNVTFDEVREAYAVQARGLIDGGVDALLLETQQDTLNVKAAAIGVRHAMRAAGAGGPGAPGRERHRGHLPDRRQPPALRGRAHERHRLASVQGADRRR